MMPIHTALAAAVAAALAAGGAQAQTSPRFTIETLPTLGGSSGSASAVNDVTWSMQTPLDLVSGPTSGNPGLSFATLGGIFTFASLAPEGSFQAVFAPVPEPAASWLMLAGILGVAGRAARASRARRDAQVA
jgi:hypothetical protein